MAPLRVVVVGEDPLARSGVAALLSAHDDLMLAGQVAPDEAVPHLRATDADVAVWDAGVEAAPDLDALRDLVQMHGPAVVVLTAGEASVPDLLAAGARAVLPRDTDAPRLASAVQAVALGLLVVDGTMADAVVRTRPPGAPLLEPLTPRETEVLHLVGQGLSNRMIAERLRISEHTAKFHVNAILGKLGAQTRAEAVAQGARLGLLLL